MEIERGEISHLITEGSEMDYKTCRDLLDFWRGVAFFEFALILAIGVYWAGRRFGPNWEYPWGLAMGLCILILILMGVMLFVLDVTSTLVYVLMHTILIIGPLDAYLSIFMWGAYHRHNPRY